MLTRSKRRDQRRKFLKSFFAGVHNVSSKYEIILINFQVKVDTPKKNQNGGSKKKKIDGQQKRRIMTEVIIGPSLGKSVDEIAYSVTKDEPQVIISFESPQIKEKKIDEIDEEISLLSLQIEEEEEVEVESSFITQGSIDDENLCPNLMLVDNENEKNKKIIVSKTVLEPFEVSKKVEKKEEGKSLGLVNTMRIFQRIDISKNQIKAKANSPLKFTPPINKNSLNEKKSVLVKRVPVRSISKTISKKKSPLRRQNKWKLNKAPSNILPCPKIPQVASQNEDPHLPFNSLKKYIKLAKKECDNIILKLASKNQVKSQSCKSKGIKILSSSSMNRAQIIKEKNRLRSFSALQFENILRMIRSQNPIFE